MYHEGTLYYRTVLAEDIEAVLETHQHMQDRLAEDMISMAKSLRSNALVAQDVIKGDNKVTRCDSSMTSL